MGYGAFIVANGEELAELPLARGNNSTTTISTMKIACIDAPRHALSIYTRGRIDVPEIVAFGSQKAGAVGIPNLTHNKATATSVLRENGCDAGVNGCAGDDGDAQIDGKSWCCGAMIDSDLRSIVDLIYRASPELGRKERGKTCAKPKQPNASPKHEFQWQKRDHQG